MKFSTLPFAFLLALCTGCHLITSTGESISSSHHHGSQDTPIPRTVHTDDPVPEVKGAHPRLTFTDSEIPAILAAIHRDPALSAKFELLKHEAEKDLDTLPAEYVRDTEKALVAARRVSQRVTILAGMYRLGGDKRFAERAKQEMLAAAAWPDWHAVDFLPTAELLNAEGVGYDWLYHYLTPQERETIHQAILSKGLRPAKSAYDHNEDWTYAKSNHNPVGNGGVAVAAVAIADEDAKFSKELIGLTRKSLPPAMNEYGPDGGWPEGPIYWDYATRYATFYLAALDSGVGTDFGTSTYPGLAETGMFRIHSTGPTKKTFNFGDAEEQVHPAAFMFYMAKRFNKPVYAAHEEYVSLPEANIFEVIWRAQFGPTQPFERLAEETLPRDAVFRGIDVAFLRGDWVDPGSTWVGFKAGTNKGTHRHLDLGSFVMDALGQRWALDLGADDYGLPGYNGSDKRWTYYRCRTEGHNTLTINNSNQDPDGDSQMVAFHSDPKRSYAVVDMTNAYPHAHKILRGVALLDRRDVAVIDEIDIGTPSRITWNFHTQAKVSVDGANATLRLGGRTLHAQIIAPADATFEVVGIHPPAPQKQEPDVSNLIVRLPSLVSHARIIVLLTPDPRAEEVLRGEGATRKPPKFEALDSWIQEGKIRH